MLRTARTSYACSYDGGNGPLLASTYAQSPRHSHSPRYFSYHKATRRNAKAVLVAQGSLLVLVLGLLVLLGIWLGMGRSSESGGAYDAAPTDLGPDCPDCGHKRTPKADFHHSSDLSIKLARGRKDLYPEEPDEYADRSHGKTSRQSGSNGESQASHLQVQQEHAGGAGSNYSNVSHSQQRPIPVAPPAQQRPVQQQQPAGAAVDKAPATSGHHTGNAAAAGTTAPPAASHPVFAGGADVVQPDPLHDSSAASAKEAAQLAALSRAVQQQQDTISRQAKALMDLQKRFVQQERQLQAATASAAASNTSEGADVEPYFPQERVQQELDMLHKVEAQIDEVSTAAAVATAALPQLTREQQAAQVQQLARADQLMSRLSRVAAAISLRTSDPLTEGGHDPVAELRHYYGTVASTNVTLSWQEALNRQLRPTAAELGIAHVEPYSDAESDLETLDIRLEYALAELTQMHEDAPCQIGLVATWSGDLWGVRREVLPWITYHAQLGVSRVYMLYDGSDQNTLTALLDLHPYVRVMLASAPLANASQAEEFKAWLRTVPDSHIKEWSSQPGNYQLMTKQGFAATKALELARADNVSWLIHMDPDELLHPAAAPAAGNMGAAFSLLPELCGAPDTVPSIRFVNVEGVPEAADLINRYEQVTLFRAHRHLVQPGAQPYRYIFKQGHADAWLHLYTNGKSAVRPDAPGVTQGGPHVFLGPADKRWETPDNPHGLWRPVISNSTLVLHYAYATPGDVAVKAGRSCPESVVEAALAGDTAQAAKCFVLDIDQRAFLAAIKDRKAAGVPVTPPALPAAPPPDDSGPVRELLIDAATLAGIRTSNGFSNASWPVGKEVLDFFWGELALSEGAPFECLTPDGQAKGWCAMANVGQLKSLLISSGLMMRLHAPAQAMKGIEAAIKQLLMISGRTASQPVAPGSMVGLPVHDSNAAVQQPQQQPALQEQQQPQLQQEQHLGAAWSHEAGSDPAAVAAASNSAGSTPAATANAAGNTEESVPTETPKENSAAAQDVLLHNDDAALSRDDHAGAHSTSSSGIAEQAKAADGQPVTPEELARETGASTEETKDLIEITEHVSQDVAQSAKEHEEHKNVPKSVIRDKMLLT